eukprot:TRINITY_DN3912_c0_g1_i3.p1 TRINITY_DN3912_c0_g1~~TRINITY_DN3912_c0_g1_i3.p1  ORF type:complete len:305 (+),score=34.58 TRINITY_DN3912_c0_g1_i3:146-1060(+)
MSLVHELAGKSPEERSPTASAGCTSSIGVSLSLPDGTLSYVASFLHAFSLVGAFASVDREFLAACQNERLCVHAFQRDLWREDAFHLPSQPSRRRLVADLSVRWLAEFRAGIPEQADEDGGRAQILNFVKLYFLDPMSQRVGYVAHVAAKEGRPSLLSWAALHGANLMHGANLINVDLAGRSALMVAALNNKPRTVEAAVVARCDPHQVHPTYGQAIHMAAFVGAKEAVEELCRLGSDLTATDGTFGLTPLHVACSRDHAEVVRVLLAAKSDLETKDKDGMTALAIARSMRSTRAERLLVAARP